MSDCYLLQRLCKTLQRLEARRARQLRERKLRRCGTSLCNERLLNYLTWRTWHSHTQTVCQHEVSDHEDRGALTNIGNPSGAWGIGELEAYDVTNIWIHKHLIRHVYAGPHSHAWAQIIGMIGYEEHRYRFPCVAEAHELAYGWY